MSNNDKTRIHPELLKILNSSTYRKKVKRVVESIKNLRGLNKLPGRPHKLKASATDKEKERHAKMCAGRPDRSTAHYFAQSSEHNYERKIARDESKAAEQA
jgi:hypothetical protein